MTELFSGTPGSGKSLHAARRIYHHLAKGRKVVSNQPINVEVVKSRKRGEFVYIENFALDPGELIEMARGHKRKKDGRMIEGQTLLVIDECWILFNSRTWNKKGRERWIYFFIHHRKYGYDIILISPIDRLVDRQIRSVLEFDTRHREISKFKTLGALIGLLFGGKVFVAVKIWNGTNDKDSAHFFRLRRRYTRLYDSYRIFEDAEGGGVAQPGPLPPPGPPMSELSPGEVPPAQPAEVDAGLLAPPDGMTWDSVPSRPSAPP